MRTNSSGASDAGNQVTAILARIDELGAKLAASAGLVPLQEWPSFQRSVLTRLDEIAKAADVAKTVAGSNLNDKANEIVELKKEHEKIVKALRIRRVEDYISFVEIDSSKRQGVVDALNKELAAVKANLQLEEEKLRKEKDERAKIVKELSIVRSVVDELSKEKKVLEAALDQRFSEIAGLTGALLAVNKQAESLEPSPRAKVPEKEESSVRPAIENVLLYLKGEHKRKDKRVRVEPETAPLVKTIKKSGLFDVDWYLTEYADVKAAGVDPITHYLRHGAKEGRNPSADFDTLGYLARHSEVRESGVNPLIHYIQNHK